MKPYPLTTEGVASRIADLYALPDPELAGHAIEVAADFCEWVKSNFTLDTAQIAYIDGFNPHASSLYGAQCSLCFLHRVNITLDYPTPPITPGYGKWTGSDSSLMVSTNGSGAIQVTGELSFFVAYTV